MKRRDVLRLGAGSALVLLPALGCAQGTAAPQPAPAEQGTGGVVETIVLTNSIGRNHGHELVLSATDALKLLRQTKTSGFVALDIQVSSGHPHALELTHAELLALVVDGTLTKDSTVVASHAHAVTLILELK